MDSDRAVELAKKRLIGKPEEPKDDEEKAFLEELEQDIKDAEERGVILSLPNELQEMS